MVTIVGIIPTVVGLESTTSVVIYSLNGSPISSSTLSAVGIVVALVVAIKVIIIDLLHWWQLVLMNYFSVKTKTNVGVKDEM